MYRAFFSRAQKHKTTGETEESTINKYYVSCVFCPFVPLVLRLCSNCHCRSIARNVGPNIAVCAHCENSKSLAKRYLSLDAKIRIKFEYDQYHQSFFHIVRQHLAWTSIAVRVFCAATASVKMQSGRCILPGEMPGCKHRRCCQCYCSCHCGAPSLSLTKR